uniref:F-actin-capping protein subunit beta n=1 Tax=Capra hircus TaxID=9925 RepID=A0A8C2Y0Z4_CAPHI
AHHTGTPHVPLVFLPAFLKEACLCSAQPSSWGRGLVLAPPLTRVGGGHRPARDPQSRPLPAEGPHVGVKPRRACARRAVPAVALACGSWCVIVTCWGLCVRAESSPAPRRYFEGGVSSVYLWDLDHGFAGVILIKKAGDGSKKIKGCWDSIHVVEVQEKSSGRTAHYKLTSTVMLWLQTNKSGSGTMNLGGSLTRQMEKDETVSDCSPHIANIGRLVEDMENKIRSTLNEIYFGKTKDIVNGLRSVQTFADKSKQEALKNDLVEALKRKQQC